MITSDQTQRESLAAKLIRTRCLQRLGVWGAGVILLGLLLGSGWLHNWSYRQGLQQQRWLAATEMQLAAQGRQCQQHRQQSAQQLLKLRHLIDQQSEHLLQAQQLSAQQAQQLSTLRQQLLALSANPPIDGQLLEIQSLLKAAAHQLWLLQDVGAARRLLQRAATGLAEINNPALLPIRQAIAEDSRQLAAVLLPDQEALVLQLLNELEKIEQLTLAPPPTNAGAGLASANPAAAPQGWLQRLLQQAKRRLQRLISIQRQTETAAQGATLSAGAFREQLSAYLHLTIQAVLQQQTARYQHCLERGISLLQAQFSQQDPAVQALLLQLQQLQQQPLQPVLPQQLQSHILLEAFLQRWWEDSRLLAAPAIRVQE